MSCSATLRSRSLIFQPIGAVGRDVQLGIPCTVERVVRLAHSSLPDWPAEMRNLYTRELRRTHLLGSTRFPASPSEPSSPMEAGSECGASLGESSSEPSGEQVAAVDQVGNGLSGPDDDTDQGPEVDLADNAPGSSDELCPEAGDDRLPSRGVFLDQILGRWPSEDVLRVLDMVALPRYQGWLRGVALTADELRDLRETVFDPPAPIDEPGEWWA